MTTTESGPRSDSADQTMQMPAIVEGSDNGGPDRTVQLTLPPLAVHPVIEPVPIEPAPAPATSARRRGATIDAALALSLTAAVLVLLAWNIDGFPTASDDEGTYLSQAWAVQQGTGLAHYTYWYDHPPLGWIQLAAFSWIPADMYPHALSVGTGRIAMLPIAAVSLFLVYVLCRRLSFSRWAAALALLAYGLSPLSVTMMRQIYLDSFAVMWILVAFVLALSPRKHLWHHTGAGVAAALAVLSKETMLVAVPAVVLALLQSTARTSVRAWAFGGFFSGLTLVGVFYPLYAALKGELLPGEDHVSLIGAWLFQLQRRAGSGSIFAEGSNSNVLLDAWLYYDTVLIVGGVAATAIALAVRRLRAPAIAAVLLALVAMRPGGYLPAMYVVQELPFLAILLVGVAEIAVVAVLKRRLPLPRLGVWPWFSRGLRWAVLAVVVAGATAYVAPRWYDGDRRAVVSQANSGYLAAAAWLRTGIGDRASMMVVTDDVLWLDLVNGGYQVDNVIWFYKLDLDPEVRARLAHGWRDVDYIVSTPEIRRDPDSLPTVATLLKNSVPVMTFGPAEDRIEIRRINKEAS
jgi:4-amino-4-deoxy-L-arabinose transferase-like glycosyltransferase